jgi:hypothetical protein
VSPTVLREKGYRFFFFSREEDRMHIHVICPEGEAKFWLEPEIELARNYKLTGFHLKEINGIIKEHFDEFKNAWAKHSGT